MKDDAKVKELRKLRPSTGATVYFPIIGLQVFIIAFLFVGDNIIYPFLLLIAAVALIVGFKISRFQNKLKQIVD